jgi:hypothetical protein
MRLLLLVLLMFLLLMLLAAVAHFLDWELVLSQSCSRTHKQQLKLLVP